MGQIITTFYNYLIAKHIISRHKIKGYRKGLQHRLEDAIFDTLSKPEPDTIYVHWGAFESGKSRAARNAAIRLQQDASKLAILVHGYDFSPCPTFLSWLQTAIGIPKDRADEKVSTFLAATKKETVLIIDQLDIILKHYTEAECVEALHQVGFPVLLLVSSWERALELTKQEGCQLLGKPGFGRWTEDELTFLFKTYDDNYDCTKKDNAIQIATIGGSPGILFEEKFGDSDGRNLPMAKHIDVEWKNGIRALNGEDMQCVTGRFPDKNGYFHWDSKIGLPALLLSQ